MKTRAGRSRTVAASSSSSDDDISLGASQEEAPTPPTPSTDAASSSATSQRIGGGAFAAESIYPQVRGTVEGRPFNVSLLMFYFLKKKLQHNL
jgi:hypothetical protein